MWSGYAGTVVSLLQAGIMTRERATKEIQGINKQARDHAGDSSSDPENESPEGSGSKQQLSFLFLRAGGGTKKTVPPFQEAAD